MTKVCYVLSYRSPDYTRTGVLCAALKSLPEIELIEARNTRPGLLRYVETLLRLFLARLSKEPDCYILGFRGHEFFWLIRLLTLGKPLILDQMMSPYDSLTRERKMISVGGLLDRVLYSYERFALRKADLILTDTSLHQDYLSRLFGIPSKKIHPVCMGADESIFCPPPSDRKQQSREGFFRCLFYGSFLPLHGMDVILKAAALLREEPVHFEIIGGKGKALRNFQILGRQLGIKKLSHECWVDYERLPERIADADLCLAGPFGGTGQAKRIITGKAFQCLAMGKPVVIGEITADEGMQNRVNCLIVKQGNAKELAEAIRWGLHNQEALAAIGRRGRDLYEDRFSLPRIRDELRESLRCLFPDAIHRASPIFKREGI